jgi:CBS domain containing-hemolysin-like protein
VNAWLWLGLGALLTLGTAVFVAAEFSLVALDRTTVERAAAAGDRRAAGVLEAIRSLSTQLSGAQIGITLTTLIVGFLVEPSLASLLAGPVGRIVPEAFIHPVAVSVALLLATVFSMLVGELVPQNLGISAPLRTARVVAGPQRAFTAAVRPLIRVLNGAANALLRAAGVEPQEELRSGRSADELAALVRHSAAAGTLAAQTAMLLTRSLDLSTRTAADVMTPRVRTLVLRREQTAADVVRLARTSGHSRFPVIGDDVDDIAGVVHLKRAVAVPQARRAEVPVVALMSEPLRVPETVRLPPLLLDLRTSGLQLAVVVDEYGGTAGVVTLEDLVEELIGELSDEHDLTRAGAVRDGDGSWLVPGLMRPDEVRDQIGFDVPDGPAYETLGGFVMALLGRVPAVGDEIAVPGAVARVERMEGRRVDRIRLAPATIPASPYPQPGARPDGWPGPPPGAQGTEAVPR